MKLLFGQAVPAPLEERWRDYLASLGERRGTLLIDRREEGFFDLELFFGCLGQGQEAHLLEWTGSGCVPAGICWSARESPRPQEGPGLPQVRVNDPSWFARQRPALLLDRDGVINRDTKHLFRWEEAEMLPEAVPLIQAAKERGWWVLVLTNQSGVARGLYTEEDVRRLHAAMEAWLARRGAAPDGWFTCPFHVEGQGRYRRDSILRKPRPGMALQGEAAFPIDRLRSVMVGDKLSDQLDLPGLRTVLLAGDYDLSGALSSVFDRLDLIRQELFGSGACGGPGRN